MLDWGPCSPSPPIHTGTACLAMSKHTHRHLMIAITTLTSIPNWFASSIVPLVKQAAQRCIRTGTIPRRPLCNHCHCHCNAALVDPSSDCAQLAPRSTPALAPLLRAWRSSPCIHQMLLHSLASLSTSVTPGTRFALVPIIL